MPLSSNLARAEMAVAHVDAAMLWPSDNRDDDYFHREIYGLPAANLDRMRRHFAKTITSRNLLLQTRDGPDAPSLVEFYRIKGAVAQKHRVGNCDELAAVAFRYLISIRQVPCNVSYYKIYHDGEALHSFVILGEAGPPNAIQFMHAAQPPATWPMDAVWCDPWRREWFEIKDDWLRRVRMIMSDCGLSSKDASGPFEVKCLAFSPASDHAVGRHM